ncbi:MAG: hypothetical protein ACREL5_12335 [Gemmatimonadales bacterium]
MPTLICPERFSFIDEPGDAMSAMCDLARAITEQAAVIGIDQSTCNHIDLCAASVLNALALTGARENGTRYMGVYPVASAAKDIVIATGLPRCLGLPLPDHPAFLTYPLSRGRKSHVSATTATEKERVAQSLTIYFDHCFARYGFSLTRAGRDYVARLVGEVVANAEEHSGRQDWWVAAYLRQPHSASYGDCHLTIFNFGRTLAQSLQRLPKGAKLRRNAERLVALQRRARFFVPSIWTEENLWTVYALQEGVSVKNDQVDRLGTRGVGTIRMIETFKNLGRTSDPKVEPVMTVVSGRTHILFNARSRLQLVPTERGEKRKVIAFNSRNDLRRPPDRSLVRCLKNGFPGTLISLRFFIDPAYLQLRIGGTSGTHN